MGTYELLLAFLKFLDDEGYLVYMEDNTPLEMVVEDFMDGNPSL